MDRVLIWGLGNEFKKNLKYFLEEENKQNINIVSLVDKHKNINSLLGKPVISQLDIVVNDIDYLIISSDRYFGDIYNEAKKIGFDSIHIIDGAIFSIAGFDYCAFKKENRLTARIINNIIEDSTYEDRIRTYLGNGFVVTLGRKSYISNARIVGCAEEAPSCIELGNYTSVSWNVSFDMGLNQDHDYNRVLTYGVTHLDIDSSRYFNLKCFGDDKIYIGSDVWIGKNVSIKSGNRIGDGAVIAADSVVVNDVPDYAIYGGNPARLIKYRFAKDIISKLLEIKWWNWDGNIIKDRISDFSDPNMFVNKYYRATQ
jgi:acetyltransferase-like isoleucine patch superfamily enzyme